MLSAPFAYVVAITMVVVCGLVARTLIKVVDCFDGPDSAVESTPEEHANAGCRTRKVAA